MVVWKRRIYIYIYRVFQDDSIKCCLKNNVFLSFLIRSFFLEILHFRNSSNTIELLNNSVYNVCIVCTKFR